MADRGAAQGRRQHHVLRKGAKGLLPLAELLVCLLLLLRECVELLLQALHCVLQVFAVPERCALELHASQVVRSRLHAHVSLSADFLGNSQKQITLPQGMPYDLNRRSYADA